MMKIDPSVKAIVSSGHSDDPIMAQFQSHGFNGVVGKPYDVEELTTVLGRLINLGA
jgi:DNA-binding NarL/FixJ family response regulator